MLTINLLPEGQRKASLSGVEQFHRAPIMWIIGGLLVALPALLYVPVHLRRGQVNGLSATVAQLRPKKVEVDRLQKTLQELRAQAAAFDSLDKGEARWSRRLNILSDVTPEGVWYTDLTLDQAKGLVIQGSAIGQADPEMVNVSRLVQALKAERAFTSAVKDIQIESIKRVQDGEVEVVQFTLSCSLAEGAKP